MHKKSTYFFGAKLVANLYLFLLAADSGVALNAFQDKADNNKLNIVSLLLYIYYSPVVSLIYHIYFSLSTFLRKKY